MASLKLTARELIVLGYDEPDSRDDPETVRAIVAKTKSGKVPLTEEETTRLAWDVQSLSNFGVDAADARTATRLMKKVGIEN